jgi:hypothetical protein
LGSDQAVFGTGNAERVEGAVAVRNVLVVGKAVWVPVRAVEGRLVRDRGPRNNVRTPRGEARPYGEGQAMLERVLEPSQQPTSVGGVGKVGHAFRANESRTGMLVVLRDASHK